MMNPNLSKNQTQTKSSDLVPVNILGNEQIKLLLEKWTPVQDGFQVVLRYDIQQAWTECIIQMDKLQAFTLEKYASKFDQFKQEDRYFEQPDDQHLSYYMEENIASIIEAYIIAGGKVGDVNKFNNPIEIDLRLGAKQLSLLERANTIGNLKLIKSRVNDEANELIDMLIVNLTNNRNA